MYFISGDVFGARVPHTEFVKQENGKVITVDAVYYGNLREL